MRKLRFVFLLVAAVVIAGVLAGSFFRPGTRSGTSGGGGSGGAASPSTTAEPTRISCLVEQGDYGDLLPEVWENGHKLSPVDEIEDDGYTFDVYEIIPGVSEIRFKSTVPTKESILPSKGGDFKAGSGWTVYVYVTDTHSSFNVYHVSTVQVPSDCVSIRIEQTHL